MRTICNLKFLSITLIALALVCASASKTYASKKSISAKIAKKIPLKSNSAYIIKFRPAVIKFRENLTTCVAESLKLQEKLQLKYLKEQLYLCFEQLLEQTNPEISCVNQIYFFIKGLEDARTHSPRKRNQATIVSEAIDFSAQLLFKLSEEYSKEMFYREIAKEREEKEKNLEKRLLETLEENDNESPRNMLDD